MPTQYKLGDKTFQSTGDVAKDIALIKQNFPEVDTSALEKSLSGGQPSAIDEHSTAMATGPQMDPRAKQIQDAVDGALSRGDPKEISAAKSVLGTSMKNHPEWYPEPPKAGARITAAEAANVGEANTIPSNLDALGKMLRENTSVSGPIMGRLRALNPYDDTAQNVQSRINATRQMVGKFLEGGVLRKEDESKYEKILPTLKDTPSAQEGKLAIVRDLVSQRRQGVLDSYKKAGYDMSGYDEQPSFLQNKLNPQPQQAAPQAQPQASQPINQSPFAGMSQEEKQAYYKKLKEKESSGTLN